jgi:type I restriction enzyme, S subunit
MINFKTKRLGDFLNFQRGFDLLSKERLNGKIPVISSSGITGFHNEYKVKGDGVIIGRKGTLGSVHYSECDYWPHDTTLWVTDFKGNYPKFIYYFLPLLDLKKYDVGSSNPTLNRNFIHEIIVSLPDFITQKKIAAVLSALDAKIEVNNRINAELENLAKTIYDYWFVQFDFPNEDGKPYKASGGEMVYHPELKREIPAGWEVITISELMDVKDGTHDSPKPTESGFPLITSKHLLKTGIDFGTAYLISEEDYNNVNKRSKVESNDILISMIGTIGETYFVKESTINFAIKNIGLFKTSQNVKLSEYIYLHINSFYGKQYFASNISGSIQNYLTLGVLRNIPLIIPIDKILDSFILKVKPTYQKIHLNNQQNQQLTQLRDWLLPLLMNGQITVK